MRSLRRTILSLALSALAVAAVACTQDNPGVTTPTDGSIPSGPGPVTSNEDVHFKPGAYAYAFNDITAALKLTGSTASLEITNASGADVGAPSLYAITGDAERVDATVDPAAPIADGQSATFKVTFPDKVNEQSVGLIVLLLGEDNMGAMAPVPVEGSSPSA